MSEEYICQFCGLPTESVDVDYVWGGDHLSCVLEAEMEEYHVLHLAVPIELIKDTPNDMELGKKIRELYNESKDNS